MKAMILAAGLGTRLKPITDTRPKALAEIAGRSLLQITLARLRDYGIRDVIVNVHHFADMVVDYLKANDNFGMHIKVSREDVLLDTGGGLKKAAWFFLEDVKDEPFVLHNVDVISTIDLERVLKFHLDKRALATLAVKDRDTSRYLIFDERLRLCGRQATRDPNRLSLAFSGIHVISPRLLSMLDGDGAFSIVTSYLNIAAKGEGICAFRADEYYWRDLGRPADLSQAAEDFRRGIIKL
jgi:NDP-sugar pyrophosphorylase family protein